ncbi:MAG: EAL domain-containing protein [Rhodocyclaceae bacterium]|nr:EAL domain-containing protein [Rhodocyclaceae bacterium]
MRRLSGSGISAAIDVFLYRLSVYGVPAAIGLASLVALALLPNEYPLDGASPLELSSLQQDVRTLTPPQALAQLADRPALPSLNTGLSESPFWFSFEVPASDQPAIVELPSRHALDAACWRASDLHALGAATRDAAEGAMKETKTGFALELGPLPAAARVLCRAGHTGPAHISAILWPVEPFHLSELKFHRNSGLLDGGLIVLSLFVLMTAIIGREWLYVLFAAWLVANLRLAAISAGWDTQWLEGSIPADWMIPLRKLTTTAYYVLTFMLFSRLFSDDLKQLKSSLMLRIAQWSCVALLLAAVALPYASFLPVLWVLTACGGAMICWLLIRILTVTRSRVAMWYGAALAIALLASLNEVLAAALGYRTLIGSVNSVTAALSSSLLAALAIAEQIRQERLGRMKAQDELRNTYEAIPIGLFSLDEQGRIVQGNPAYKSMLGRHAGDSGHWADGFEAGAWERLQALADSPAAEDMELRSVAGHEGSRRSFLVKATRVKERIEGSLQDITLRVEATARLRFLADHDPLTGIFNRRGIEQAFDTANRSLADGNAMALAYLDLDRFKLINDLFGHVAGDMVLRHVCQRIDKILIEGQVLGRIGGDEFVVIFPAGPIRAAAEICRQIISGISTEPYAVGERAFQVKCSIGLVEIAGGAREDDAVSLADRACREAKTGHEGNLVVYRQDMSVFTERTEELRLIQRLDMLQPEGLFLMMQPIMSLRDPYGSLNFEVLLRMRDKDNTVVPAWKIITAAERNGRIATIDKWVLTTTLEWLRTHDTHLKNSSYVSVNLSGGSLNDEKFIEDAFSILEHYGSAVGRLCIEITESVALHDLTNTRHFIDGIRKYGAKLALDDFGAGYTSFSYLRSLPADAVKIDGAYVKDLLAHPANQAIVQAIVDLTRNLGMKCIAEWAEDVPTLEALAEMGVDYVQGYVVSRPLMPERILLAGSAADCIEDEDTIRFVRNTLAPILVRADQPGRDRFN